jgi:type II secretory ATPase GspE/PulE/Tfp pilus assembly ATPase PilB-like protein
MAMKAGMRPLRQAGAEKVAAGVTTIDEVLSLTPEMRER